MQLSTNGRVRRSTEEWREIINRLEASGLSSRAFCRQEQVNLSSLMRWRRRLDSDSSHKTGAEPGFVELPVPRRSTDSWAVEVELANGCIVRIRG